MTGSGAIPLRFDHLSLGDDLEDQARSVLGQVDADRRAVGEEPRAHFFGQPVGDLSLVHPLERTRDQDRGQAAVEEGFFTFT